MHLLPQPLWLLLAIYLSSANATQPLPTAVRKMSPDAGEKYYHHYHAFAQDQPQSQRRQQQAYSPALQARQSHLEADARLLATNASAQLDLRPAFAPLSELSSTRSGEEQAYYAFHLLRRVVATLEKRQWACPSGTGSCLSIGYPNSCCQDGETCVVIQDTGLGPVGCCPSGSSCGGTIYGCAAGNTACASELGGGCCIPGYLCEGVGCVSSSTTVASLPTSTSTSSTSSSTTTLSTSTTTTSTSSSKTTTNQPTTTSQNASAPVRPTSSSNTYCPTGFYACLAVAGGGCCQTGRDCQTTSCPPAASSTTVVDANGVTVAVPASGVPTSTTAGTCATGWSLCGKEAGATAGCCPTGYGCGTASCSLVTAGATATVAKALPESSSSSNGTGRQRRMVGPEWVGFVGALVGLVMMLL